MSRKGWYGCLYLNPSGKPVQCAEILGLSRPARSVACACWSARDHHSNIRFCGQDCSGDTTSIPCHLKKTITKKNKGAMSSELPLHYFHGDIRYRRQTEETEAEYFPISWKWLVFTVRDCWPLTLLSRLLRHACQVIVLLFFVPL
jgi:hypothetical protein